MTAKELTEEQISTLVERVRADPGCIEELTAEEVIAVRKAINAFGTSMTTKGTWVNMSIINWRQNYLEKLLMTTLSGFMFKCCDEFEPEEELDLIDKKYAKNPEAKEAAEAEKEAIKKTTRNLIRRFLLRNLQFDSNRHIREAKDDPKSDQERQEAIEKIKAAAAASAEVEEKLSKKREEVFEYVKDVALQVGEQCQKITAVVAKVCRQAKNIDEDAFCILTKQAMTLSAVQNDLTKITAPLSAARTMAAFKYSPPADTFHNLRRYFDNNYSQLVLITQALYSAKPDIEFAIKLYGAWDSEDKAKSEYKKNSKEYTSDVVTIQSGGTTLLGPYKENIERVDYYNSNTEVLKMIDESAKRDAELGKDMIKKRVTRQKDISVRKQGPDAASLQNYVSAAGVTSAVGKRTLSKQELEELNKVREEIEDAIVPEDAIQLNVFKTEYSADGEAKFTKSKMYTQAEDPLHLSEANSPYANQYQPVKPKTLLSRANEKKKVKSRTGEKKTLAELVDEIE